LFLPAYALLIGRGLVLLRDRSRLLAVALGVGTAVVCSGTLLDLYGSRYLRDEYRTVASFMESYREPGDAAILYSDWEWPVYQYYAPVDVPALGVSVRANLSPESAAELGGKYLGEHPGIW